MTDKLYIVKNKSARDKARVSHLVDMADIILDRVSKDMQKLAKYVEELQELT